MTYETSQLILRRRFSWFLPRLIYTGFGLGLAPCAPGTCGTLLGLPLYFFWVNSSWAEQLAVLAVIFYLGWWAAQRAEVDLGRHDDPQVVIDEVAGYLVTMFAIPAHPGAWIFGFIFFRFFDILKPWPINVVDQKILGGVGVMVDDVMAGLYAQIALRLVLLVL
ncbi:MAG: phosphatidylglycerophosphatase A [Candidatus Adiutrix intracellularis]|nr:phosphatidylglycerophosphatase A [Candidatus Adiutrix intracellularis]